MSIQVLVLMTAVVVPGAIHVVGGYTISANEMHHSKVVGTEPYRPAKATSLVQCMKMCVVSAPCTALVYWRLFPVCFLYNTDPGTSDLTVKSGSTVVWRADIHTSENLTCESVTNCVKECPPVPSVDFAQVFGNEITTGSKLKYVCDVSGDVTIVSCGQDGQWSQLPTCEDPNAVTFDGVCGESGYTVASTAQPWASSKDECYSLGGAPVAIETEVEDMCIRSILSTRGIARAWIGLHQPLGDGTDWIWEATGEVCDLATSYTGFLEGEPARAQEECIIMHWGYGYQWVDTTCTLTYKMVCEFNL